jgi:hypothetical protein
VLAAKEEAQLIHRHSNLGTDLALHSGNSVDELAFDSADFVVSDMRRDVNTHQVGCHAFWRTAALDATWLRSSVRAALGYGPKGPTCACRCSRLKWQL